MSEILYAYLAGAIDADGYITIQKSVPSATRKDGRKRPYFVAKVGLQQVETTIPDLLEEAFGGYRHVHTPSNPAHLPWYQWSASNQIATSVLTALLPFLRIKHGQAETVLAFNAYLQANRHGSHVSDEDTTERERFYLAVTKLNRPRNRRVHLPAA